MSEENDQEKTEQPTDKKLEDARKRGEVAVAPEMRHAMMFGATIIATGGMGLAALSALARVAKGWWGGADAYSFEANNAAGLAGDILWSAIGVAGPLLGMLFVAAFLILFVQGRPSLSWSRVGFKWSKLSVVSGFGRLFGTHALVEFGKTLAKFAVVVTIAWLTVRPKIAGLDRLIGAEPIQIGRMAGSLIGSILVSVTALVVALAVFDFVYQHRAWLKRLRMSMQEIRDEMKEAEGDPKIKSRIRSLRMSRSRTRMITAVPAASVIITNPTHYAIALKYEHGIMAAPIVVAKGVDAVAFKIREVATAAGVPIVENPPLARALYAAVDIEHPIPVEHYAAVAEVIGFVMRLGRANPSRAY